ncbi:MAG: alpha/beta hydrolase [Tardiphaga sp.]|nr:alpha/beta hydrolase [Tardiphaga sp.]
MAQTSTKSFELSCPYQPPQLVRANGIELCYDIFGEADAEPMLMIMGLGAQMIHWDDEFCREIAGRGFRVIRFDNRDIGLSSKMTGGKPLTLFEVAKLRYFGTPVAAPYKLSDMAADAVGLLDALGIDAAHIVGASMGGMIAQEIAISHPARLRSLTSIMSTTGHPRLPQPSRAVAAKLLQKQPTSYDEFVTRFKQTWLFLRVGDFPDDEARDLDRAERTYARGLDPDGVGRQLRAILASGSRKDRLAAVTAPTVVIHGKVDPLVHPAGGRDTAASIPGATLLMIDGMGHALPISMWRQVIDAIARHAHGKVEARSVRRV